MPEPCPKYRPILQPNLRHSTTPTKRLFAVNLWEADYAELELLAAASNLRMSDIARHAFNTLLDTQRIAGQGV